MNDNTLIYAARMKDRQALMNSSSGGIFTVFSDKFLENGDAVACVLYHYQRKQAEYRIVTDAGMRDAARGSKYMQSIPGDIYQEALSWLKTNPEKQLLFVGVGCQTAGFKHLAAASGLSERVVLVDIICHGAVSPALWKEYAESLEKKYQGSMEFLTFKDKRHGWNHPTAAAVINGQEIPLNDYVRIFNSNCALRPACYRCPYAAIARETDITIGDFWGIEKAMPDFYDEQGNSLLLIHTEKGRKLFESCKNMVDFQQSSAEECLQPNLIQPSPVSEQRQKFWKDYRHHGAEYVIKKYGTVSFRRRIQNKVKKMITGE